MKNTIHKFGPVAVFALVLCAAGCGKEEPPMSDNRSDDVYLSTDSETQARANAVLPSTGSEDASHILGDWKPAMEPENYEREEYLPEESVEWVVDVPFPDGQSINAKQLSAAFEGSFRKKHGPCSLYGKNSKTGLWSYLISAGGPGDVSGLKVAYAYNRSWDPKFVPSTEEEYRNRLEAIRKVVSETVGDANLSSSKSVVDAAKHASLLAGLTAKYDKSIAFYLVANEGKPFTGKQIWDVMMCLGLQWGDMDCFHWNNAGGAGDDSYFSVETSTPPGYFLPEQIAADQLNAVDLIFVFSVPRSCEPKEIALRMNNAVKYCQSRLDGQIHYTIDGAEVDFPNLLDRVETIVKELTELGFEPGTDSALRMF